MRPLDIAHPRGEHRHPTHKGVQRQQAAGDAVGAETEVEPGGAGPGVAEGERGAVAGCLQHHQADEEVCAGGEQADSLEVAGGDTWHRQRCQQRQEEGDQKCHLSPTSTATTATRTAAAKTIA